MDSLIQPAEKYNVDIVCIKNYRVLDKYGIIKVKDFKSSFREKLYKYNDLKKYNHLYTLNRVFSNNVWGKLYRIELFYENSYSPLGIFYGEDLAFNLRVTENIKSCYVIDSYKYYYRYGEFTLSIFQRYWHDSVKL